MKKILILLIVCLMITGLFTANVSADSSKLPGAVMLFDETPRFIRGTLPNERQDVYVDYDNLVVDFEPLNERTTGKYKGKLAISDARFSFFAGDELAEEGILEEYPIFVMRVKLSRAIVNGSAVANENEGFSEIMLSMNNKDNAKSLGQFYFENTTEWQLVVVDLNTVEGLEDGSLVAIRIDPVEAVVEEPLTIEIEYIALFDSMSSIDGFNGDLNSLTPTQEPTTAPTEAPVTEAPATEAPATEVPATDVPSTKAPDNNTSEVPNKDSGCGASSAVAQVMFVLGIAIIIKKRK